jgi:ubiquinone/menaquinone biosynthesis C-methylase UbiE
MTDWRSYDTIADAYERTWGPRFQTVARHLLAVASPVRGARLLDLGAGTGAVASALGDEARQVRAIVGCDLSARMLDHARQRVPSLRAVVADAAHLPFRDSSFDLATANCVLSHVREYRPCLAEVVRVLARPGALAMASWGASSDPYAAAWKELLDGAVGAGTVQRAGDLVAPSEGHFSSAENVRAALVDAGFVAARIEAIELIHQFSVEEYLADRELGSSGRFGRHAMGEAEWRRFLEKARGKFLRRFGESFSYGRPVVLGLGTLA